MGSHIKQDRLHLFSVIKQSPTIERPISDFNKLYTYYTYNQMIKSFPTKSIVKLKKNKQKLGRNN